MIIWENILFWFNKVLILTMFAVLYDRSDFLSFTTFIAIFLMERKYISKEHVNKFFHIFIMLILLDILWFSYCVSLYLKN